MKAFAEKEAKSEPLSGRTIVSMMKFDMHCHTKAGSIDASVSVERYIELLSAQGFDGMLITDHDSYKGYHKWMRKHGKSFWNIEHLEEQIEKTLHKEHPLKQDAQTSATEVYSEAAEETKKEFCVLAGIEYDTKDAGHFIVIMPDHIRLRILQIRGMSVEKLIYIVHRFGGILGPAHPFGQRSSSAMFFKKIKSKPEILQKVDFIEGFNTCEKEESNRLASALASKLGKPCTGGSDAHNEAYVGMAYTLFDREITCNNDLIAAIREGQIVQWGGQVRSHTRKAVMKDAFYSVWGFKVYNRGLGFLFAPYRKYRMHKLNHAAAEQ